MLVTKRILTALAAGATLIAVSGNASAAAYNLFGWYQVSSGGTLSSLMFKAGAAQGCPGPTYAQPCYNPAQLWTSNNGVATGVAAAGPPTWDWDGTTLTETGLFWATSFIGSNPNSNPVISDKVTNLTITPSTQGVTAATYQCIEGGFLSTVGANGCLNVNVNQTGGNFVLDSSATWNVGNAKCVVGAIGGDDYSLTDGLPGPPVVPGTFIPRGLEAQTLGQAGAGCAQTSGAFDTWNVVVDDGNVLILSNTAPQTATPFPTCPIFGAQGQGTSGCPGAQAASSSASYLVFATPGAPDADADGVPDRIDNCKNVANANQRDTNVNPVGTGGDGYGNICDPDFNGDLTVNINDFNRLKARLNILPVVDLDTDLDGNGAVNINDFNRLKSFLGKPPGPSGWH
jgi:hypothetical protein